MTEKRKPPPGGEKTRFSSENQPARRRGPSITSALKRVLAEVDERTGKEVAELLARSMVKNAMAGNSQALRQLLDRVEGQLPLRIKAEPPDKTFTYVSSAPRKGETAEEAADRVAKEVEETHRQPGGEGPPVDNFVFISSIPDEDDDEDHNPAEEHRRRLRGEE